MTIERSESEGVSPNTAPLPIGTRVRIDGAGILHGRPGWITDIIRRFDDGHDPAFPVVVALSDYEYAFTWGEVHRFRARPYDPATEHAKIIDGNTMGTGKHVDMQHYATLPKHSVSKRYDMRLDGVRALLAQH